MKFYKITKELDQKNVKGTFLVGGELLTEKEAIKFDCLELLKNKAEKVNISKFKTHWCFGTRRANTINIMNTIEKDIIIAEFIEMQKTDIGWFDNEGILSQHIYDETGGNCHDNLYFSSSWDWLMPVIKKLDSIANEKFTILEFDNYRTQWAMIDKPSKYPIEKVYEQTVQFIEHLNKVK